MFQNKKSIIDDANNHICSDVKEYIESLSYKVGDKVSCSRCDVCWIANIVPERGYRGYTGKIDVRINPSKKDGTRSNREFVLLAKGAAWVYLKGKKIMAASRKDAIKKYGHQKK